MNKIPANLKEILADVDTQIKLTRFKPLCGPSRIELTCADEQLLAWGKQIPAPKWVLNSTDSRYASVNAYAPAANSIWPGFSKTNELRACLRIENRASRPKDDVTDCGIHSIVWLGRAPTLRRPITRASSYDSLRSAQFGQIAAWTQTLPAHADLPRNPSLWLLSGNTQWPARHPMYQNTSRSVTNMLDLPRQSRRLQPIAPSASNSVATSTIRTSRRRSY